MRLLIVAGCVTLAGCDEGVAYVPDAPPAPPPQNTRVELVTAPGSSLLSDIATLRFIGLNGEGQKVVTLTVNRDNGPIPSSFDLTYAPYVEGFDASGALIAVGKQVACEVNPDDPTATIYIAPPASIGLSPARLSVPRSHMGIKRVDDAIGGERGIIFAGGNNEDDSVSDVVDLFDPCRQRSYRSTMPARRSGTTVIQSHTSNESPGYTTHTWIFGGRDAAGTITGSLFQFDTQRSAPFSDFVVYGEQPGIARADQREVAWWISGDVALRFNGESFVEDPTIGPLPSDAIGGPDQQGWAAYVRDNSIVFASPVSPGTLVMPPGHERSSLVTTAGPLLLAIGGTDTSAVFVDVDHGRIYRVQPDVLRTPRFEPTLATSGEYGHLLVIGGVDASGQPIATAEIFEVGLAQLTYVATVPIVARRHPLAISLRGRYSDDYVFIVGGDEANDAIEVFTPPNPRSLRP